MVDSSHKKYDSVHPIGLSKRLIPFHCTFYNKKQKSNTQALFFLFLPPTSPKGHWSKIKSGFRKILIMKSLIIFTTFSYYLATCLAMTDTVKLLYNDGTLYNEIDIPITATEVVQDIDIRTGSQQIPITDIYATQILSKHEEKAVFCTFQAIRGSEKETSIRGSEEETSNTAGIFKRIYERLSRNNNDEDVGEDEDEEESLVVVGAIDAIFDTTAHFTSPPQNVEMVSCYVIDPEGISKPFLYSLYRSIITHSIVRQLFDARLNIEDGLVKRVSS